MCVSFFKMVIGFVVERDAAIAAERAVHKTSGCHLKAGRLGHDPSRRRGITRICSVMRMHCRYKFGDTAGEP